MGTRSDSALEDRRDSDGNGRRREWGEVEGIVCDKVAERWWGCWVVATAEGKEENDDRFLVGKER